MEVVSEHLVFITTGLKGSVWERSRGCNRRVEEKRLKRDCPGDRDL